MLKFLKWLDRWGLPATVITVYTFMYLLAQGYGVWRMMFGDWDAALRCLLLMIVFATFLWLQLWFFELVERLHQMVHGP